MSDPKPLVPSSLQHLIDANHAWARRVERENPGFFADLARQQSPKYLWIGCSDSRVPANQVIGLAPGEVFVHRNIANVVVHSDLNALSVIEFAVEQLRVEHILVVGHYGCAGVLAVLRGTRVGMADNWLRHVHDVATFNHRRLVHLCGEAREDALCEMNVIEQVGHVAECSVVQRAWERGQPLAIHGWCYGLKDGLVRDLQVTLTGSAHAQDICRAALARYPHAPQSDTGSVT
jgi:carbonic anhydrase